MIILAFHNLRRVTRHRALLVAMIALPLLCGVARALSPESRCSCGLVWVCPLGCALIAWGAISLQRAVDDTTGFSDAVSNSPVGARGLALSRVLAAALLMLIPIIVFTLVLVVRQWRFG